MSGIPFRATLVIGGDFNACLEPHKSVSGSGVTPGPQTNELVQERSYLLDMLAKHRLTVLNRWGKKTPTYLRPSGNSQIDFVRIRQHAADKRSKQAGLRQEGLAARRSAGHVPVVCSIRPSWRPWIGGRPQAKQTARKAVSERDRPIQQLRDELKASCPGRQQGPKLPALKSVDHQVDSPWSLRQRIRQISGVNMLKMAFQAMRAEASAQKAHRELKRACRQRKRSTSSGTWVHRGSSQEGRQPGFLRFCSACFP